MSKKIMFVVSVLLIAVFALSACAPAATPAPTAAPAAPAAPAATEAPAAPAAPAATEAPAMPAATEAPAAAPVELTLWHAYGTGSAEETAMTKLIAQASKDMPNVKINVLQIPFNDVFNKYRTDVAAGGGPDMFIAPNDSLGDDARASLIADITDNVKGKLDSYAKLAVDGMTVDGKVYGVPESLKAVAFYYNKSMLPEPPKTTDELKAMLEKGTPISISFGCYHYWGFFNAFGGKVFDDKFAFVSDQGTGMVDAMTYLNDLYQLDKKANLPKTDTDAAAPFREGKIAATTNGNWALGDYKTALGDKLGVAPLPAGPKGPSLPLLGVDGYYISPNSQNKQAAVDLALYLTNAANQTLMMNDAGHVPSRTDVTITDPYVKAFSDAFTQATVRPQDAQMAKYWANFCGPDQVFEKGTKPADWIKTATDAAKK